MNLYNKFKKTGLGVTDLSAQMWCEKQLEFSLTKGRKETPAMVIGRERHKALQEGVLKLVAVEPKSFFDFIALKLHNSMICISQVMKEGLTREMPVFGKMDSIFLSGYIDELKVNGNQLFLLDTKTKKNIVDPSESQKDGSKVLIKSYEYSQKFIDVMNSRLRSGEIVDYEVLA